MRIIIIVIIQVRSTVHMGTAVKSSSTQQPKERKKSFYFTCKESVSVEATPVSIVLEATTFHHGLLILSMKLLPCHSSLLTVIFTHRLRPASTRRAPNGGRFETHLQ